MKKCSEMLSDTVGVKLNSGTEKRFARLVRPAIRIKKAASLSGGLCGENFWIYKPKMLLHKK
jgi:hypothetical protein